jgi:hypothetical protein
MSSYIPYEPSNKNTTHSRRQQMLCLRKNLLMADKKYFNTVMNPGASPFTKPSFLPGTNKKLLYRLIPLCPAIKRNKNSAHSACFHTGVK